MKNREGEEKRGTEKREGEDVRQTFCSFRTENCFWHSVAFRGIPHNPKKRKPADLWFLPLSQKKKKKIQKIKNHATRISYSFPRTKRDLVGREQTPHCDGQDDSNLSSRRGGFENDQKGEG